jgi:hypothetical protein
MDVRKLADRDATPILKNEYAAPSYGGPQRDAINSVIDNIVGDLCGKIETLRKTLDEIEAQVLKGAAGSKGALHDQISMSVRVNDEIVHMQAVVKEIQQAAES